MHVQVKAENEKLKRLLTAPLRTRQRETDRQTDRQSEK